MKQYQEEQENLKYLIYGENDIILDRNENWWGSEKTKVSLEKITINRYATLGEMYNAFKIGNVDVISTDNTNLKEYIGRIGYNEKKLQGREHTFLVLNTQNKYLSSVPVRKAIAYSIDKENIVSSIFSNQCYVSNFPLEYGTWIYQSQATALGFNPDQGKEELTNEGWTLRNNLWQKGTSIGTNNRRSSKNKTNYQMLELNMLVKASDATKVAVAQNIQAQLKNQGITINIVQAGDEQYIDNLNSKNFDIALCSMNMSPNPSMELFFGENNLANYTNDEITEKMQEVKNTTEEEVLKADYERIGEIYKTEVPYISLYTNQYNVLYNTALLGDFSPNWFSSFYSVETWAK